MLWLAFILLFVFEDGQSLFLRHTGTGKCITVSQQLVYDNPFYSLPYFVVMTDNCLERKAQFRYRDSQLLQNIENGGTLAYYPNSYFRGRWVTYKGVANAAKGVQQSLYNRLMQTSAGSLFFYGRKVCAEPSSKYLLRKTYCNRKKQEFTIGSVTAFAAKMKHTHCSPIQRMVVKSADCGDFINKYRSFNGSAKIDTPCSQLANCQVKSLCDGNRSCELTMDSNLLPSKYCSDTSKQIYTKYTCVDTYRSSAITAVSNIRLTQQNAGHIEIRHGSSWRKVEETNWNKKRQEMLCQHLGFGTNDGIVIENRQLGSGKQIVTGDLICYNTRAREISCCTHLKPSISTASTTIPYVECSMCDSPLLHDERTFSDSVFSGHGDSSNKYKDVRISKRGWCPSGSGTPYLLLDLQKEYHITGVVVMADKEQTNWSASYILGYSGTSYKSSQQIRVHGNQNGYQASRTSLDIYNVRYVKIQPTVNRNFCLRIELCGEVQTPAAVTSINVSPSPYSATVTWIISATTQQSTYITHLIININNTKYKIIPRGTQVKFNDLKPNTWYTVGIQTQDGTLQKSQIVYKTFRTEETDMDLVNSQGQSTQNWKQCVWNRVDDKDAGLIQNCSFNKKHDNTSLRVFYEGTLRSYGSSACNRWYFTFDGEECTKPATIEGLVYVQSIQANPQRHRHIEGYCNQVPKGHIRVGFWIGKCKNEQYLGDGDTGWTSTSRIVIEEVPPPQA